MKKNFLFLSRLFNFSTLFYLLFCLFFLSSAAFAVTDMSLKQLKQQDIERAMKYERLKNTEVSGSNRHVSPQALPVDTDDDGMPDSWEIANGLNPNDPDDAWFDPDRDEVVNLFEYQLDSDLNNPTTPPVATVAPSGADYTDVETAIDSVAPGTAIRVAGGSYPVNYMTFSSKVVMIQGGWNLDFSQRDLKLYPTTFDGGMQDEILYFSVSGGEAVIILDGLNFIRGKGTIGVVVLLAQGSAFMRISIFNCSITESETGFDFCGVFNMTNWDDSQSDRTIANSVIGGNDASGIYSQNTENSVAHWRIINTTMSHNLNGGGDNGYGIEAFTLDSGALTAHIYNSIIWGNEQEDISIRRNITFNADHSDIGDVDADFGAIYNVGPGVVNVDPLFVDPANNDFHLQDSSPVIDVGINQGIPLIDFEGDPRISGATVDMGADEYLSTMIEPIPDIKANGSDGPVHLAPNDNLSVTVGLNPGSHSGENADWWVVADIPFGWYYYNLYSWIPGFSVTYQGPLFDLSPFEVLNITGLPVGTYTFYFGVDMVMNGSLDMDQIYYDSVEVNIE